MNKTMKSLTAQTLVLLLLTVTVLHSQDCWQERANAGGMLVYNHKSVWTGSELIVWGGSDANGRSNLGGRYNRANDCWTAVSVTGAPTGRSGHTAVWTGSEMIVWGGSDIGASNTGGRYNPSTDSWTTTATAGAPAARYSHTAVWTGSEMIIWGGADNGPRLNTGGRYNPATDSWTAVTTAGAPAARHAHTAVWTGSEMIIWGGIVTNPGGVNTGARYNPTTNSWTATTTAGTPTARYIHTAVWTGSEMIVWGGDSVSPGTVHIGGRYNPVTNTWTATTTTGAPAARAEHGVVWTGSEMIVWGGDGGGTPSLLNTGGRYSPAENSWTATTTTGAPSGRFRLSAVWTGSEMLICGKAGNSADTFSYTPDCEEFRITTAILDGGNLSVSFPTRTGHSYTLWQSTTLSAGTWASTGLSALSGTGATLTFTVPAEIPGRRFFRVQVTTDP